MLSKSKCHDHLLRSGRIRWYSEGIVEPRPEFPVREQVHTQQRHQIRHRPTPARLQLHKAQHQHCDQGGPHLGSHRRQGGADERLDLQILLQCFEKEFHRPAVLIDRGDGLGSEPEVVRQELKLPLLLLIVEAHQPKRMGASLLCLWATEANQLIFAHGAIGRARNRQVLHHLVHGVVLQTRDKIHPLIRPAAKELVVVVPSVIRDDRPGLQFQCLRHRHVVNLAGRDHREARQVAVVIEQQVQLDRPLGGTKLRPVVHRKAQVNHRGVQAHQLVLEAELLRLSSSGLRQLRLTAPVEQMKHVLVQLPGPMPVHVRQRGSAHHLDPQVRELALAAAQPLLDLPQAVSASELAENHRDELLPAAHAPSMPLGIEPAHLALEVRARNKLENLTEQAAKSVHVEPLRCRPKRFGSRFSLHGEAQRPPANLDDSDELYSRGRFGQLPSPRQSRTRQFESLPISHPDPMSEVTLLIRRAQQGDRDAAERAFALLYADLRTLARRRLSRSRRNAVLETTELVNEAYLRLTRAASIRAQDRAGYLAYASRAMRSVIVDLVRARLAARRGGGASCLTLDTAVSSQVASGEDEIIRVHEALEELAAVDARVVRVVEMRYFAGLSEQQVAAALGVTERTVRRDWEKARMLLAAALKRR